MTGVATTTFQTGDTINGSGNTNTLTVTNTAAGPSTVVASVNNVGNFNVKNVGGAVAFNNALSSNISNFTVTQGVAAASTSVANGSAATVYGNTAGVADTLNVGFTSGVTNQTFKVALGGAGTATADALVDYVQTANANEINAITVATVGNNFVTLNGTTNVTSVTVTGAGNNTISLDGASALSTTKAVTINVADATGNNTIDLGTNLSSAGTTVNGSTGSSTTTLGLQINNGSVVLPTITNVEALQLDDGSNGSLVTGTTNTSITKLTILDQDGTANANTYDLIGLSAIGSVVWGTNGGGNNFFGALSLTGSGALAETFAVQNGTALASTNSLNVDAQTLTGYTSLSINTAGGVGSGGTFTLNGTTLGTALTSVVVEHASTGAVDLGTIDSTASTTNKGTISLLDLDGIAGRATVVIGADSLAASSSIFGSVGSSNISYASGGTQAGASVATVTLLDGNNTYDATNVTTTQVRDLVTAGSGNNTILTGLGADVITVGNGANTITGGAGADVITLGSGHINAGNVNNIVYQTFATADTVSNFVFGANNDQSDLLLSGFNAEVANMADGNGAVISTLSTVDFSADFSGGITFNAADTIFVTSDTTATAVETSLVASSFAANGTDNDGIFVVWVDASSDLHISVAQVTVTNAGIDTATLKDVAVLTGTYSITDLNITNFDFV